MAGSHRHSPCLHRKDLSAQVSERWADKDDHYFHKNNHYPEPVRIELYRRVGGGGFELIGVSMQFVPVRSGNRTTQFSFNYTFRPQDAQVGKVTFKAIVFIENANDAFPADNEAVFTPLTVVRR